MSARHTLAAFAALLALAAGCTQPKASTTTEEAPPPAAAAAAALTRVENVAQVCMVNDQFMGKEQIPVTVGGKTYFGCCAMCKEKLEKSNTARTATDPVTGKPVDKAVAVIARDDSGKVFYFESEDTMRRFKL